MSTHQLQELLGHSQSRTTDRYVKQAGLREQRLHDIAAAAAMGDLSKSNITTLPQGGK